MKIKVACNFKHGKDEFHLNDVRTVSDEDGQYFIANGWATDASGRADPVATAPGETTLEIQNVTHQQTSVIEGQ